MNPKSRALASIASVAALLAFSPIVLAQEKTLPSGSLSMGADIGASASDSSLTTKVRDVLKNDPSTTGAKIEVTTMDGVVTLSGSVDSKATADHATQMAASISGVKVVNNQLKVAEGSNQQS